MTFNNGEGVLNFIFISFSLRTKMFVFSIDKYDIARFRSCVNYQSSQISDILRGQTKPSKVTIEEVWRPASHSALKRKSENRPAFFSILFYIVIFLGEGFLMDCRVFFGIFFKDFGLIKSKYSAYLDLK